MNTPLLTQKQVREYAWWSSHVTLPAELVNELYRTYVIEGGCIDDDGHWQEYTEQDAWDHVRMYAEEYDEIKQRLAKRKRAYRAY